jgi:hypothetical protein
MRRARALGPIFRTTPRPLLYVVQQAGPIGCASCHTYSHKAWLGHLVHGICMATRYLNNAGALCGGGGPLAKAGTTGLQMSYTPQPGASTKKGALGWQRTC